MSGFVLLVEFDGDRDLTAIRFGRASTAEQWQADHPGVPSFGLVPLASPVTQHVVEASAPEWASAPGPDAPPAQLDLFAGAST